MKNQKTMQVPGSGWARRWIGSCWVAMLAALTFVNAAQAGGIATNENVTTTMNNNTGTANDPALYVIDNYTKAFAGNLYVGSGVDWVQLLITNGSLVSNTSENFIGGDSFGSDHNRIVVTGAGSRFETATKNTRIGSRSQSNELVFEQGASGYLNNITLGYNTGAGYGLSNTLVIAAADLVVSYRISVGYTVGNDYNRVVVRDGGTFTVSNRVECSRGGSFNEMLVTGTGSALHHVNTSNGFALGNVGATSNNVLTITDGGLVKLYGASTTVGANASQGKFVRLAKGFLAYHMNDDDSLLYSNALLWNGSDWEVAPSVWRGTYYANDATGEAAAFAATGYSGLAGYTVFTGGKSIAGALNTTLILVK